MRRVYQQIENDGLMVGDCCRAAIASILDLRISQVPHFVEDYEGKWHEAMAAWLRPLGFQAFRIASTHRPEGLWLGCGCSPRGLQHMVVMKGSKCWHDPHRSNGGLKKINQCWVLVPHDPAFHRVSKATSTLATQAMIEAMA